MNDKKNECQCVKSSCGCAKAATARCTCGETCNCERVCRCGNGCDCATKK